MNKWLVGVGLVGVPLVFLIIEFGNIVLGVEVIRKAEKIVGALKWVKR